MKVQPKRSREQVNTETRAKKVPKLKAEKDNRSLMRLGKRRTVANIQMQDQAGGESNLLRLAHRMSERCMRGI